MIKPTYTLPIILAAENVITKFAFLKELIPFALKEPIKAFG